MASDTGRCSFTTWLKKWEKKKKKNQEKTTGKPSFQAINSFLEMVGSSTFVRGLHHAPKRLSVPKLHQQLYSNPECTAFKETVYPELIYPKRRRRRYLAHIECCSTQPNEHSSPSESDKNGGGIIIIRSGGGAVKMAPVLVLRVLLMSLRKVIVVHVMVHQLHSHCLYLQ